MPDNLPNLIHLLHTSLKQGIELHIRGDSIQKEKPFTLWLLGPMAIPDADHIIRAAIQNII